MHTVCAGATNRSAGVRRSKNCVESVTPALHVRVRGEASSVRAVGASWAFSRGASGSTSAPVSKADATTGELSLSALIPGRSSANRLALWPRKLLIRGAVSIRVSKVGGASEIDSWMYGRATLAKAPKVDVERHEHLGLGLGDRRHLGRAVGEGAEEAPHSRLRRGEVAGHRHEAFHQGPELAKRHVQVGPAARQRVAEGDQVALRPPSRCRVPDVEELVDLDGLRRGDPERQGRPLFVALASRSPW